MQCRIAEEHHAGGVAEHNVRCALAGIESAGGQPLKVGGSRGRPLRPLLAHRADADLDPGSNGGGMSDDC